MTNEGFIIELGDVAIAPGTMLYTAPRASWYFARLEPSGTIIAVEPNGTEHVVKNGDTNTEAARQLLNAMMRDLT